MLLDEWLWKNRMTRTAFAELVGLQRLTLGRIARGSQMPSISTAKRIQEKTNDEVKWYEIMDFCWNNLPEKHKNYN